MTTLKVPDMPIRFLTQEEFTRIYEAEPSLLFRDIFLAGLLTGLRVGDVVSLTRKQIDLDRRVIRIATTKSGRMLAIPIHPTLHLIFQRRWESEPTIWGRAPHRTTVTHKFKCAATKAGIPDVHLHLLRKTFASWLALNGADIFRIQQLLGHSTPTLTAKLYSSLTADSLRSEIERLPSLPTIGGRSEMGQRDTEVTGVTR